MKQIAEIQKRKHSYKVTSFVESISQDRALEIWKRVFDLSEFSVLIQATEDELGVTFKDQGAYHQAIHEGEVIWVLGEELTHLVHDNPIFCIVDGVAEESGFCLLIEGETGRILVQLTPKNKHKFTKNCIGRSVLTEFYSGKKTKADSVH